MHITAQYSNFHLKTSSSLVCHACIPFKVQIYSLQIFKAVDSIILKAMEISEAFFFLPASIPLGDIAAAIAERPRQRRRRRAKPQASPGMALTSLGMLEA